MRVCIWLDDVREDRVFRKAYDEILLKFWALHDRWVSIFIITFSELVGPWLMLALAVSVGSEVFVTGLSC